VAHIILNILFVICCSSIWGNESYKKSSKTSVKHSVCLPKQDTTIKGSCKECLGAITEPSICLPQKSITINVTITKEMLSYRYFGIDYSPEEFHITINGKNFSIISKNNISVYNEKITIPVRDNMCTIKYGYSFAGGLYKGQQEVPISVLNEQLSADLHFSWYEKQRLYLKKTE
jgi:hypothetical protein